MVIECMRLILIILLLLSIASCNEAEHKGTPAGKPNEKVLENGIELVEGYGYYNLVSTDSLVLWYENYLREIHIYNLIDSTLTKIEVPNGRGPGEITIVGEITVLGNELFLMGLSEQKLISLNLEELNFEDKIHFQNRVVGMTSNKTKIFFRVLSEESFFYSWDGKMDYIEPLKMGLKEQELVNYSQNMFDFEGTMTANDNYLVFSKFYKPELWIYDLSKQERTTFFFDEFDSNEFSYHKNEFGLVTEPPKDLKLLIEDIEFVPTEDEIIILGKGRIKDRAYSNKLIFFDLNSKMIEKSLRYNGEVPTYLTTTQGIVFLLETTTPELKTISLQ